MEQIPSNTLVMGGAPGPAGWLPIWIKVITKPYEQTFVEITEHPDATSRTAFIWIFIAGTISGIFQAIVQAIYAALGTTPQFTIPGMEQFTQQPVSGDGGFAIASLVGGLCASPIAGIVSVLFFAIGVAITQWVAKLFGGTGNFEKLAYATAAISVPFTLVSSVLTIFNAIPYVVYCTGILSFGLGLYALYLQVTAVKSVNRFGWGAAIGSVLLPGLVVAFVCGCLVIGTLTLLAPAIGDVFNGINQTLTP